MTNCGSKKNESCCASPLVCGGTYYRTYTNDGTCPTGEADPAIVSSFRLDKYLVTVGRFRQFVNAWNRGWMPDQGSGKHTHLNGGLGLADITHPGFAEWEQGWQSSDDTGLTLTVVDCPGIKNAATWTPAPGNNENLPMNCINWYEAYAFCIWDGGFLPSEAEWEYAAAGGIQQREYPWGSAVSGMACPGRQYAIFGCNYPNGPGLCSGASSGLGICEDFSHIAPVGFANLGAGAWEQLDLAGSLQEWTMDWYVLQYMSPCSDCAYLTADALGPNPERVTRGGSFYDPLSDVVPTFRSHTGAAHLSVGFRCARAPSPSDAGAAGQSEASTEAGSEAQEAASVDAPLESSGND
jgi:formylglycine-generating enzyme required for sulfatase activity